MMHPVYIKFPVTGVHMPDGKYYCNESTCRVELNMLSAKSSGVYKCEVSGDAPHFKLAAKEDNLTVAGKTITNTHTSLTHTLPNTIIYLI